jgi:signal transduction histidine kinase
VLVVDDDRIVADMYRLALTRAGHDVSVASDGQMGLEMASSVRPDFMFLDMRMPKMGGVEVGLNRTKFDLAGVVSEQATAFTSIAELQSIEVVKPELPVLVSADPSRITTVVANLLDNAIKYSPDTGVVTVEVGQQDGYAFVAVRDHGVGIATEHIPLLFQRFSRLPTEQNVSTPGTGLGLFLCQAIAQRHGGAVEVDSSPGEGSVFTLRLPLAAPRQR